MRDIVRQAVARVTLSPDQIEIAIDTLQLAGALGVEGKNEERIRIIRSSSRFQRSCVGLVKASAW